MKKLIILCFLTFFASFVYAQHEGHNHAAETTKEVKGALLVKEDTFNFGKIPQGKPVHHNFEVVNNGTTPLKINNVQASCGCTTPEWEKDKEIKSGERSIIKVGYNAASEGTFNKTITITYDETQTKILSIKGEVWKTPAASAPSNSAVNSLKEL